MSTPDIKALTRRFANELNNSLAAYRKAVIDQGGEDSENVPEMTVAVNDRKSNKVRTPRQQAELIVKGKSWSASSSHMTDNARHINLRKGNKVIVDAKRELTPEEYRAFVQAWNDAMRATGLRNFKNGTSYDHGDEFHLELPDTKLPFTDARVQDCLAEYARMTREEGKKKNANFEREGKVKKYLTEYEKRNQKN
jgi:hypothetical protein